MISLLVPWHPAPDAPGGPERAASWEWIERRLRGLLPEAEIVLGAPDVVGDPGVFSRSLALNRAAAAAQGDVLIVCDADTTLASRDDFLLAAALVAEGRWTLPDRYVRLNQRTSRAWMGQEAITRPPDDWDRDLEQEYPFANSGVVGIPHNALAQAGGFDERFKGWGGEDDAMRAQLETLWEAPTRVGIAYHLWHPRLLEQTTQARYGPESRVLADRYGAASGDRQAMRALIAERLEDAADRR